MRTGAATVGAEMQEAAAELPSRAQRPGAGSRLQNRVVLDGRSTAPGGSPIWIILVDAGFGSEAVVDAWCAGAYPALTPQQLDNTCAARALSAPHD